MTTTLLRMRGSHAWIFRAVEGLPAAPPYLVHEMYFTARRNAHRVRHRRPLVRCTRAVHRSVGSAMN
jgi:hypothetical protein